MVLEKERDREREEKETQRERYTLYIKLLTNYVYTTCIRERNWMELLGGTVILI